MGMSGIKLYHGKLILLNCGVTAESATSNEVPLRRNVLTAGFTLCLICLWLAWVEISNSHLTEKRIKTFHASFYYILKYAFCGAFSPYIHKPCLTNMDSFQTLSSQSVQLIGCQASLCWGRVKNRRSDQTLPGLSYV